MGTAVGALLAVGLMTWAEHRKLHRTSIPRKETVFAEWNGYQYHHTTDEKFDIEGDVVAMSPNGGAFCSGAFKGGPGTAFVVNTAPGKRKHVDVSLTAFGAGDAEAMLHGVHVGSHVHLSGTVGPVSIQKDGQEVQRVEPSGNWLSLSRQYVVVAEAVDLGSSAQR